MAAAGFLVRAPPQEPHAMPSIPVRFVASALIAASVLCPAGGRAALAGDSEPTVFQQAIRSWMGVVALLADEGEGDEMRKDGDRGGEQKNGDESRRDRDQGGRGERWERGDRAGRADRDWSRRGERGERGPRPGPGPGESGPQMRMPPRASEMRAMQRMPMPGMRGDPAARLDEIVARLSRIEQKLDAAPRMGNPWSPRPDTSDAARRSTDERMRPPMAAMPPEMQERMRTMMQEGRKRMAEAGEKMEQARKKFQEMEARIKKLEAEVERLKAGK